MPFDFWAGWVAVLTVASVLGLVWFVFSIYFRSGEEAEDSGMVWDGNLREGAHPVKGSGNQTTSRVNAATI